MAKSDTDSDTGDTPGSSVAPELDTFTTGSLKKLQTTDERKLLDVVDKLRRTGLNGTIELPQLVVCGDQSSGKSSVLEALTEIPFPRKAGLCTRFATEIVLRRQPTTSVTIKINPHKLRTDAEKQELSDFKKTITNLSELPDVMEAATQEMGLGKVGESEAFSRDVLSIEICGPDRPQLTLVDLPGLIHSATKSSTDADKDLIHDLVQEYMENPRTIILAVVSAKNDAANQIILSLFKKIDQKGSRTLGIITKPDCMSAGDEEFWFNLALNKEILLERGWHMVKNRTDSEVDFTFKQRNEAEEAFFNKSRFKDLPRHSVGIEALYGRLSKLLLHHLVQELPSLKEEMKHKLRSTEEALEKLGEKRGTSYDQRMALMKICLEISQILRAAVDGHYLHSFFEVGNLGGPAAEQNVCRRLRAVVQSANHSFAEKMRLYGHKYKFGVDETDKVDSKDNIEKDKTNAQDSIEFDDDPKPQPLAQAQAVQWVGRMISRCRGLELPGSINPEVTSHMFWEQSGPWRKIAEGHIEEVGEACKEFVEHVLEYAAPAEFIKPLQELIVKSVLEEARKNGQEELKKLLEDKARHPSTYNHYYSDTVQKRRQDRIEKIANDASREATTNGMMINPNGSRSEATRFHKETFEQKMSETVQRSMQLFSAEEAMDSLEAYYKDELKYFVHAITKQVIERCMIDPLPSKMLSPMAVTAMTDEEVAFVAAELPETVTQRAFLEERRQMLEKGFDIFREAMGGVKRGRAKR
ncbi:hypothetical protein EKO04_003463 [Ascochyta lentis]|uniref:Dynamin family protein n=1 Tax=Ascochyta lentis TaxID=205686 RepID=A0A8H7J777_9PLEO|nr:hypothetical protein EKO04_003463 [Ascochyta lentis]